MFGDILPPTKNGQEVPETDGAYKKWKDIKEGRRKIVEQLTKKEVGLVVNTKKASDGKGTFLDDSFDSFGNRNTI